MHIVLLSPVDDREIKIRILQAKVRRAHLLAYILETNNGRFDFYNEEI